MSSLSNLSDALDASHAEAWRPQPGDKLIGRVVSIDQRDDYNDDPYPVVTVQPEQGDPLAWHAFTTVGKAELAKWRPEIGETIGVIYKGRHPERKYHLYRVAVDGRPPSAPDWGRIGRDASAELDATASPRQAPASAPAPAPVTPQPSSDDDIPF